MKCLVMRNNEGFTLVELSLVLVIIGLLMVSILKGEALIENAKVKSLVRQKDSFVASIYTFYDKYGMYPGDENLGPNVPTNDTHDGNGGGTISGTERYYVFEDLALANLIHGNYTGATNNDIVHPFGGHMYVLWQTRNGVTDHWITITNLPAEVAETIDRKYDDGTYNTGSVIASSTYTNQSSKTLYWRI
ncbi:MAG: prepilin-type N-terminal cleavage/methylation domain-containing protein [Deltaproteobacteria bacterium]|nr:prepilin-type N-terminal cleavage/methylation domain-containing protein [Deltaproteobacteria bacterium]